MKKCGRKPRLLNVRLHLQHVEECFAGLAQYGLCPAVEENIRKARFINRKILEVDRDKRARTKTRKDIVV